MKGKSVEDNARKVMALCTGDGDGLLGYTGLGATALGNEPVDWMSATLRGRSLPFERSLSFLCDAMRSQIPKHLVKLLKGGEASHHVIIPAIVENEVRLYSIDLQLDAAHNRSYYRCTKHIVEDRSSTRPRTARFGIGGSGASKLLENDDWMRPILRLIKASGRGLISPLTVADSLAELNHRVATAVETVGPNCIVAWQYRPDSDGKKMRGDQHYEGTSRVGKSENIPTIMLGFEMHEIAKVFSKKVMALHKALDSGDPEIEKYEDDLNAAMNKLDLNPDDKLR